MAKYKTSFKLPVMKIKMSRLIALCAFVLVFILSGCGSTSSLIVTVNFGNPPQGGGPCMGKGVCSAVAHNPSASGVTVTLYTSSLDKNALAMTFSMNELKQKQPDQAANFTDGGTYNFDGPFQMTDQLFAPLNLAPNARIDQNSKSKVAIKGDLVTVVYTYTHN